MSSQTHILLSHASQRAALPGDEEAGGNTENAELDCSRRLRTRGSLAASDRELATTIQAILNDPAQVRLGDVTAKLADWRVKVDGIWRFLPLATVASTYSLLKMPTNKEEKPSALTVSTEQRKQLAARIEAIFGPEIKQGGKAGQIPLVFSAAALYGFITNTGWKSSDTP